MSASDSRVGTKAVLSGSNYLYSASDAEMQQRCKQLGQFRLPSQNTTEILYSPCVYEVEIRQYLYY